MNHLYCQIQNTGIRNENFFKAQCKYGKQIPRKVYDKEICILITNCTCYYVYRRTFQTSTGDFQSRING